MIQAMFEQLKDDIENEIDTNSLQDVIDALTEVCRFKGQHILENWQDTSLAQEWENVANKLEHIPATNL